MNGKTIDHLLISLATMLIVSGVTAKLKDVLRGWAIGLIIVGLVILTLGKFIVKDLETSFIRRILTTSVGLILVLTGANYFLEAHLQTYWVLYIIVGILIFEYHDKIMGIAG